MSRDTESASDPKFGWLNKKMSKMKSRIYKEITSTLAIKINKTVLLQACLWQEKVVCIVGMKILNFI